MRGNDLQRLEHPHEEPFGPDTLWRRRERIRLFAKLPRKDRGERCQNRERDKPSHHVAEQKVGKERHAGPRRVVTWSAHTSQLNEQQMPDKQRRDQRRKHGDMECVEARECCSGDVFTAAKESQKKRSGDRHAADNLRADLRCEERELVPRQKISAEPECQDQHQQCDARDPCHLARWTVGARQVHARHVNEERQDHQVRGPAVDRADEPAKPHFGHDELNAFEC